MISMTRNQMRKTEIVLVKITKITKDGIKQVSFAKKKLLLRNNFQISGGKLANFLRVEFQTCEQI